MGQSGFPGSIGAQGKQAHFIHAAAFNVIRFYLTLVSLVILLFIFDKYFLSQ